ncbi:MAG: 30S ribosomal protein S4e [Candidatus Aenigmarchaeota archaeon]|nr:30S ribosomal protein S4e [Candidatus Aenigmarchaeota archaeon]
MHEKRIAFKGNYKFKRKSEGKFIVVPSPGPHPKDMCIPLGVIIRDFLNYGENMREARNIINSGKILIDGKVKKDHRYPVGLFDLIEIPDSSQLFRILPGKKYLELEEVPQKEKGLKICRVDNKTVIKGGKIQLNLHDGKNILTDKGDYKTGDSILVEIPKLKIKKHIKRKEGSVCIIIRGENKGKIGKIKKIEKTEGSITNRVTVEIEKRIVSLPEKFIFVIGEKEPEIKVNK